MGFPKAFGESGFGLGRLHRVPRLTLQPLYLDLVITCRLLGLFGRLYGEDQNVHGAQRGPDGDSLCTQPLRDPRRRLEGGLGRRPVIDGRRPLGYGSEPSQASAREAFTGRRVDVVGVALQALEDVLHSRDLDLVRTPVS